MKLQHLYKPSVKEVKIVEVPQMNFLMIDGDGGPNHPTFQNAIEVLFPLSYTSEVHGKKRCTSELIMVFCRLKDCGGQMICLRLLMGKKDEWEMDTYDYATRTYYKRKWLLKLSIK